MKKRIRDIAEIRTGYQFRGKVEAAKDPNVKLIQIKDIDEKRTVRTNDLLPIRLENPEPYLVSQGDVLFLSRGHRQYAVVVSEVVEYTVATGYFFILRPYEKFVSPDFLTWSINQADFQESMRPYVRGSHIPFVSKADFQNLTIDLPSPAVQAQVVMLQRLFDREQELALSLLEKQRKLVQAISQKLIQGSVRWKENR